MIEGDYEPDDSNLWRLQFILPTWYTSNKSENSKRDSSEELKKIAMIFYKPMAVNEKYHSIDQRKRKALEYMDQSATVRWVGNVKVYSEDPDMQRVVRAGYIRKPTNCPIANLAHLSANRSLDIFDAVSGKDLRNNFRFVKYGRNLTHRNKNRVIQALNNFKTQLVDFKKRIFWGTVDDEKTNNLPFLNVFNK